MLGMKKDTPEFVTKWEKENSIVSYHWVENTVKDIKTGKNIVISAVRKYGINNKQQMIKFSDEVDEYFNSPKVEKEIEETKKKPKK